MADVIENPSWERGVRLFDRKAALFAFSVIMIVILFSWVFATSS